MTALVGSQVDSQTITRFRGSSRFRSHRPGTHQMAPTWNDNNDPNKPVMVIPEDRTGNTALSSFARLAADIMSFQRMTRHAGPRAACSHHVVAPRVILNLPSHVSLCSLLDHCYSTINLHQTLVRHAQRYAGYRVCRHRHHVRTFRPAPSRRAVRDLGLGGSIVSAELALGRPASSFRNETGADCDHRYCMQASW
jgi:hypothetical protein